MRISRTIGALLTTAALAIGLALPATLGAQDPRLGSASTQRLVEVGVLTGGVTDIGPHATDLLRQATLSDEAALVAPATAFLASVTRLREISARIPSALVGTSCRTLLLSYRASARMMLLAARYDATGRAASADGHRRRAASLLRLNGFRQRICENRLTTLVQRINAVLPQAVKGTAIAGIAFTRSRPYEVQVYDGGTLTGAACPDPADEMLGVVVSHAQGAAGHAAQVAFGHYPGTPLPISIGISLTAGSGLDAVTTAAVPGLRAGAAEGHYVAVLVIDGRPAEMALFTVDCA